MDRPHHPQSDSSHGKWNQKNKSKGLLKRQVRRLSSDKVAIPEQSRSPIPFGISTRKLMLLLLLPGLFAPGLAQPGAPQNTLPGSTMLEATRTFLATLDPAQKAGCGQILDKAHALGRNSS